MWKTTEEQLHCSQDPADWIVIPRRNVFAESQFLFSSSYLSTVTTAAIFGVTKISVDNERPPLLGLRLSVCWHNASVPNISHVAPLFKSLFFSLCLSLSFSLSLSIFLSCISLSLSYIFHFLSLSISASVCLCLSVSISVSLHLRLCLILTCSDQRLCHFYGPVTQLYLESVMSHRPESNAFERGD